MRFFLLLVPVAVFAGTDPSFDTTVKPFLSKNCVLCHNSKTHTADLNLEKYQSPASVDADRDLWERVVNRIRNGEMPPKGMPLPKDDDIKAITTWVEQEFASLDKNLQPDPGRVTARRLNRVEYNNTIRDLLALKATPAENFPADDSGYGFDNNGDVLSLSPVLMEKYLDSADRLARMAVGADPLPKPTAERYRADRLKHPAKGITQITPELIYSADYELRFGVGGKLPKVPAPTGAAPAIAAGTKAAIPPITDPKPTSTARAAATPKPAGKEPIIGANPDARPAVAQPIPLVLATQIDGGEIRKYDIDTRPDKYRAFDVKLPLPAGQHDIKAWIVDPTSAIPEKDRNNREKSFVVDYIEVRGPFAPDEPIVTASQKAVFVCGHLDVQHDASCPRRIVSNLARHAFRRTPTDGEIDRLVHFVELAQEQGDTMNQGIQLAVKAILVSPQFLFRIEADPRPTDANDIHHITDFELASRLSYFLWSSMPDDELLHLAETNQLHNSDVLDQQVRRMLKDKKADALVDNFAGQWLELRNLDFIQPDPEKFPMFNRELRNDMKQETRMFFEEVIHQDHSILDFLNGKYTYLNERLAKHYGIEGVKGNEFRRVALDGVQRSGVLTQASILTVSSYPNRTSPVIRGKWLLENILNDPPPPPPPGVPSLDTKGVGTTGSLRQQLEKHRASPVCASCHNRMDPLGFGLENYNAVGQWRTKDGNFPIDSSGTLPNGKSFTTPAQLKEILMDQKDKFAECLTEKLLTYALGRGLERFDKPAVAAITKDLGTHEYKFSRLVSDVVTSMPFQMRRGDPAGVKRTQVTVSEAKKSTIGGKS